MRTVENAIRRQNVQVQHLCQHTTNVPGKQGQGLLSYKSMMAKGYEREDNTTKNILYVRIYIYIYTRIHMIKINL